jgi:hypothetical protein
MGGPRDGWGKVRKHVESGDGEGVEDVLAGTDMVAGISITEETSPGIQRYKEKEHQKQEISNRGNKKIGCVFWFNQ